MLVNLFLSFSLFIAISLIHISISFCQENDDFVRCGELFNCGSLQNIGYPFYGQNRSENCGYPGFNLTCDKDVPFITIGALSYRVIAIDNTAKDITVARVDLWSDLCPTLLHNTSLDSDIFSYDPNDLNISLYYGCSLIPGQVFELPNTFNCSVNGSTSSSFYLTFGSPVSTFSDVVICKDYISVPVNQVVARSLANLTARVDDLRTAIDRGFTLKWSANNTICNHCTNGGGRCGILPNSSFICYCADGVYPYTCHGSNDNKTALGLGLGMASLVLAGIGIGGSIFFCRKRREKVVTRGGVVIRKDSTELITSPINKAFNSPPSDTFTKRFSTYPSPTSDSVGVKTYFGVTVFHHSELEEATDHFHRSKELGDGGFGAVYHGILRDGREVAVKRLYENNCKRVAQYMNEVQIVAQLRHKNLVLLYGCTSKSSKELILVYEFIPNGTVAEHIHGKREYPGSLSWPIRLNIAVETAEALAYLHESDIIHRDVKTTNILLDNDFHVKVADFGLSRLLPTDVTHVSTAPQGTPGYVDPEYYQYYQLTEKSDVYSFGVVLIELISSLPAVDTNRHRHDINLANMAVNKIQNQVVNELVDQTLGFETDGLVRKKIMRVAELAFRCLQQERDMRPSMQEVLVALRGI